jgi:hypothetical protein
MWVAAERREQESDESLSAPHLRHRAERAREHAETLLGEFERLELEWAALEASQSGGCPAEARIERARDLALTRSHRLRIAFCDAILSGTA